MDQKRLKRAKVGTPKEPPSPQVSAETRSIPPGSWTQLGRTRGFRHRNRMLGTYLEQEALSTY
eukprot:1483005-Amphidinium_carterae.1